MTKEEMMEYYEAHNTGDYKKTASLYLTEDIVFENPQAKFVGSNNYFEFFVQNITNQSMREVIHPKNVLIAGDDVAAEIDVELIFLEDKPNFPFGSVKKGDSIVMNNAAFYKVRNGRIAQITVFWMKYWLGGVQYSFIK